MAVRIKSITVDCIDPFRLAQFWSEVTGFVEDPDNGNAPDDPEALLLPPDRTSALLFIAVPEAKQVKNRVHLDLVPLTRDRDGQVDHLLAIGARWVSDERRPDGSGWVVLADPEGNEFCVERSDRERRPTDGRASPRGRRLRLAVVLHVEEESCVVVADGSVRHLGYAPGLPSPRMERVSPGHLVAVATAPSGSDVVVWRWYDAVVVDGGGERVRLWEPAHGEIQAVPRDPGLSLLPGTRAYVSAGLPGADWWVGGAVGRPGDLVDVDEVERFYDEHGLWDGLE